jgi:hypothetical protein
MLGLEELALVIGCWMTLEGEESASDVGCSGIGWKG